MIEGCKTWSVDDFLVACNENDKIVTIYDKTTTKKVRDFDWLNPDAHPQPVVFEPQLRLFAIIWQINKKYDLLGRIFYK